MGLGYAKLFESLWDGSLRGKPDPILVFANLLTHAGPGGVVDVHFKKISDETGLTVKRVRAAITYLEAPDPESRSPAEDGRRIIRMDAHRDWGWIIVNHPKYRTMVGSDDGYREKTRLRVQKFRNKSHGNVTNVTVALPSASASGSVQGDKGVGEEGALPETGIPTLHEVILYGKTQNVEEAICKAFFDYHESHNLWVNRHDHLINWRHKLPVWNQNERKFTTGKGGIPVERVPLWKAIQLLEEEIGKHVANPNSAFCTKSPTELERADLRAKRKKLGELKAQAIKNA